MATDVILPALGMSQDTGKIVQWLKAEGEQVVRGEPLVEIETDKATVEIEATVSGVLARIAASAGDDVPVGQVIAVILAAAESVESKVPAGVEAPSDEPRTSQNSSTANGERPDVVIPSAPVQPLPQVEATTRPTIAASMLASRIAADHNLDLSLVKAAGKRIQKADVLTYLQSQEVAPVVATAPHLVLASPKARRLAAEAGKDLRGIRGNGPGGAILAADVLATAVQAPPVSEETAPFIAPVERIAPTNGTNGTIGSSDFAPGNIWRIMAERTTQSWISTPHFYLTREVNVSRLITWREEIMKHSATKITYTDLLVKVVAAALSAHPRVNASWSDGKITLKSEINMGLAVAIEDGLVVPIIHHADTLGLAEIARQRVDLVAKAQAGKLRPQDISGGTFTISNLGMYNVDAFNAIINQPQAAILAVGRIAERVVPINGVPAVQPMIVLTLSCDHRAIDGARGARFLDSVATSLEEPLRLLM
ncbi:MAG: dihydrolipoamide acetyltransferase family protein [Ktedonobacteraceae bacterium]